MKARDWIILFAVIAAANLLTLWIAAQVAQKKIDESTAGNGLLSLFNRK